MTIPATLGRSVANLRLRGTSIVAGAFAFGLLLFLVQVGHQQGIELRRADLLSGARIERQQQYVATLKKQIVAGDASSRGAYDDAKVQLTRLVGETTRASMGNANVWTSPTEFLLALVNIILSLSIFGAAVTYFLVVTLEERDPFDSIRRLRTALPTTLTLFAWMIAFSFAWMPMLAYAYAKLIPGADVSETLPLAWIFCGFLLFLSTAPRLIAAPLIALAGEANGRDAIDLSVADTKGNWWSILCHASAAVIALVTVQFLLEWAVRSVVPVIPPMTTFLHDVLSFLSLGFATYYVSYVALSLYGDTAETVVQPMQKKAPALAKPALA